MSQSQLNVMHWEIKLSIVANLIEANLKFVKFTYHTCIHQLLADSGHSTLREHNDVDTESEAHYDDDVYRHRFFTPKIQPSRLVEETDVSIAIFISSRHTFYIKNCSTSFIPYEALRSFTWHGLVYVDSETEKENIKLEWNKCN
jgi:hypothetical protein